MSEAVNVTETAERKERNFIVTKRVRTGRKIENKKNFLPIRSNPTRVRKFKYKSKKILKIKKHHPGFISRRNGGRQAEK